MPQSLIPSEVKSQVMPPRRSRMSVWVKRVGICAVLVVALMAIAGGVVYVGYHDILAGRPLTQVNAELSLRDAFPPATGWSVDKIEQARAYAEASKSAALIAIHRGHVVAEWGDTSKRIDVHSIRKSLVSVLYGIAADKGLIDINSTLEELGVDDQNPPLTAQEKKATIVDLLTSRSGIYHDSVKMDTESGRPARGAHAPGEFFFYNNWSFNALGTIFENLTRMTLGGAFKEWIADPIGMRDFRVEDVRYYTSAESVFPAYRFWMSARDLARFGVLFAHEGDWNGRQIVPRQWVTDSVKKYSELDHVAYGYMWWIWPDGRLMATGTGGQKLWIYPDQELVIVNRVDTGDGFSRALWTLMGPQMTNTHMRELERMLLAAAPPD